ncbi:MAG: hypothetical protein FWD27_09595 [Coriobacteriia bacterium]|nr:hypothetical protein [Coriobacteriia bacterium]
MKKIGSIARVITALALLSLFGCSSQSIEQSSNTTGSATEFSVAFPGSVEGIAAISCSKDGRVLYALTGGYFSKPSLFEQANDARTLLWSTENQGATWEPVYSLPAEIDATSVVSGAINADGDCFVIKIAKEVPAQIIDSQAMPPLHFFFIERGGSFLEIDDEFGFVDAVYASFVASNRVLIYDYSKAFLINTVNGEVIAKYDTASDLGMTLAAAPLSDDVFVILGYEGARCYDGLTGESHNTPEGLESMFEDIYVSKPQNVKFYSSGEALYCAYGKGVYEYIPQSDQYENLIYFAELMLGGGDPPLMGFAVDKEKTSYLVYYSMSLMTMAFDGFRLEPNTSDAKSVSVYTLHPHSLLNSAILKYQASNPGVRWTVEVGIDGENAQTPEDAIKLLNVRLLAGEGPDLILLDGLPIDSYIDKRVLADLSSVFESGDDIQKSFFPNIVNTYSQGGIIHALPTSFSFYAAQGAKSFIDYASDVETLAAALVKEAEAGLFYGYENEYGNVDNYYNKYLDTVRVLYCLYSPIFVNNNHLDSTALESYFLSCKALQAAMGEATDSTSLEAASTSILYQALDTIDGSSQNGLGLVSGVFDLSALLQQQRNSQVAWLPILTTATCYEPQTIIGINSNSLYTSEAEGFLRYLLSAEFQDTLVTSLPVNRQSFKNVLCDAHTDEGDHAHDGEEKGLLYEMYFYLDDRSIYVYYPEDESEITACIDLMDTLSVPITEDAAVRSIVLEGLVNYLNGHTTLSQALSHVENRANLYLAE